MSYEFFWVVKMMEVSILYISSASGYMLLKWVSSRYPLSRSKRNQYFVSLHSFFAMLSFAMKSFRDCAAKASSTFAPMDVPLLNTWRQIDLSQRLFNRYLSSFMTNLSYT